MLEIKIPQSISEACKIQVELSKKVIEEDRFEKLEIVSAADLHYGSDKVFLGYVEMKYPEMVLVKKFMNILKPRDVWEYKSEFLCFSEGVYIVNFISNLKQKPDVLILDGHGIAHPRKMGLASYVGVICDIATIGCAKKLLYGNYDRERLKPYRGSFTEIKDKRGKVIAVALRTKDNTKEVFVSAGHKISLNTAKEVVLKLSKYRIPEPLRLAHIIAKNF
ncbi:MAG: endonuclease V [Endomicrobia bacterium]|nr:endonuclease V [Endomicrobiia bacterium]